MDAERIEARLTIAVDGSHHAGHSGFGVASESGALFYGAVREGEDAEFAALEHALACYPERPLLVRTDSHEAILRFVSRVPPKPSNANVEQIARILAALGLREGSAPVEFHHVRQSQQQDALHAVAHLLSFLGRTGRSLPEGDLTATAQMILGAPRPDDAAHAVVKDMLFPSI